MNRHSESPKIQNNPVSRNVVPTIDQPVSFQSHPLRVKALENSLEHKREELSAMRRVAVVTVEMAIEELGSLDRSSMPPTAVQLLSELEEAHDKLNSLETEEFPQPEYFFSIAERLNQLKKKLSTSAPS